MHRILGEAKKLQFASGCITTNWTVDHFKRELSYKNLKFAKNNENKTVQFTNKLFANVLCL